MAGLPVAPPIRVLIARSRALAVLPFVRPAFKWRRLPRTYGTGSTASAQWFRLLRLTFLGMVVLPTVVTVFYTAFIQSPLYMSEARVAIRESVAEKPFNDFGDETSGSEKGDRGDKNSRGGASSQSSPLSGGSSTLMRGLSSLLGGASSTAHTQSPYLLTSYLSSLDYVARLDKDGWLRHFFSGRGIDMLSALRANTSLERLADYWNAHVTTAVDRRSEIVLLRVWAFSPQDAQAIATRALKDGEQLLNDIMARSRADMLRNAKEQLDRAQQRYILALARQQEWRMRQRAVHPVQTAEALSQSLLRLEEERLSADREMRASERLSAPDAPALGVLRDRVKAIDSEIADFRANLAKTGSQTSAVVALAAFEDSELEVRFAETLQAIALSGMQEAERRARAQSAFVNVFVPPSLPTSVAEPVWWQTSLFVFALAVIFWINIMLLAAVIRDHWR